MKWRDRQSGGDFVDRLAGWCDGERLNRVVGAVGIVGAGLLIAYVAVHVFLACHQAAAGLAALAGVR